MGILANLTIVFIAGLITDLATGIGAIPFFFKDDFSDLWLVGLWGLAAGIMTAASLFGLIPAGLNQGTVLQVSIGLLTGVFLVVYASRKIGEYELEPGELNEADYKELILILGILTVHSFPEGVAIGVSFAKMNLSTGIPILGATIPLLAIIMTISISIHNIPEGISISIPFKSMDMSNSRMLGATIFSSVPQPIGAVLAYLFVSVAESFLPIGYGFAGGAMIFLVYSEFLEEAEEQGESLKDWRKPFLIGGAAGFLIMSPLIFII
ncbi:MAG: ZIP family metal transporter [Candidatus Nanohaloarchaea archaeon]